MLLYEIADNRKVHISYSLDDLTKSTSRLNTGIIDNFAALSLAKLIGGGIKSMDELNAAEQCLRALIFHETVLRQSPGVRVNNLISHELELDKHPVQLTDYLGPSIIKNYVGNINNLMGFPDGEQAEIENSMRSQKHKQEEERLRKLGIPEPTFSLSLASCPLEYAAGSIVDYTKSCFPYDSVLQARFILPIAESKLPSYISYPFLIRNFENSLLVQENPYHGKEFFDSLDDVWKEYKNKLRNRIDVSMPLFLSIVLNRSKDREDIGSVILDLRDEYASAREELWSIFDQLDDEEISDKNHMQILIDIENITRDILQSQLLPNSRSQLLLALDNQKRFGSILSAGAAIFDGGFTMIIPIINAFLGSLTVGHSFNMTAAQLTAHHIEELHSQGLLEKIFTEPELYNLKRSLQNYNIS